MSTYDEVQMAARLRIEALLAQLVSFHSEQDEQKAGHLMDVTLELAALAKENQLRTTLREEAHAAACPTCQHYRSGEKGN